MSWSPVVPAVLIGCIAWTLGMLFGTLTGEMRVAVIVPSGLLAGYVLEDVRQGQGDIDG